MFKLILLVVVAIGFAPPAFAKVIGFDDRQILETAPCRSTPATLARVLVPVEGRQNLSTGFAATVSGDEVFFVTVAHSLYLKGELRAPLETIEIDVLVEVAPDICRYRKTSISKFATGSAAPRQSFHGAARDILVFQIEDDEIISKVKPIKIGDGTCRNTLTSLFAFAWKAGNGVLPYKSECKMQKRLKVSEYDDVSFLHHDCDTSPGASGGLLLCDPTNLTPELHGIHAASWGTDGRQFGDGVYNIALPVDFRTIRALLHAMEKYGD